MAEAKNSFLASKMNKDLDDRLIPSNEYKDALNVAVSNSEDSDVGALENILQNTNVLPISEETNLGADDGKIIGYVVDSSTDSVYLFWTNYTDNSSDKLSNHQSASSGTNSYILRYNSADTIGTLAEVLVSGTFLNFSTTHPIYGANVVEDLLFWTDDRNQPRKINIRTALNNTAYYTTEDHISVAKYAPYKPIDLYKDYSGTYKTTMKDVVSQQLPDGSTSNPDYNPDYAGDPNYLQDKFVRFSYRFKYDDGEYSIIAPFTQIAFIPKQDGSFLVGDEDNAYQSTVVSFMENKVNQISLVINLPDTGNDLENNYKIKEIDILYKESDGIAISVLDTVSVNDIKNSAGASSVYEYSYQSRKPIKTLPQGQTTRVYDKTPVRAFSQEVSGNRVIYGNYIDKHTAPDHLKYQVAATQKFSTGTDGNYSYTEYPEHTLKRNRNYQVGFILSDRYGRQSDVILSDVSSNNASNSLFGASTFYFPYKESNSTTTVLDDIGNSIKIKLNEEIKSNKSPLVIGRASSTGEPGLYDANTNPTGWYSYKVVVKQTQQEYYNVYLPGFLKGDLNNGAETITNFALISDNINKVPRDLQEVGPNQTKYSSSEILFPVVDNDHSSNQNWNEPFYPGNKRYEVTTIAPFSALDNLNAGNNSVAQIFEATEDPLIGRIGNNEGGLGSTAQHMVPRLSIAETAPFVSNLDIYYETSTTGLISDLNTSVRDGQGFPINGVNAFNYIHKESQNPAGGGAITGADNSRYVTDEFIPTNSSLGNVNDSSLASFTVEDGTGINRTSNFTCESAVTGGVKKYRIKINTDFYYGLNANNKESYIFSLGLRNSNDSIPRTGLPAPTTTAAVNNSVTIPLSSVTGVFITQDITDQGSGVPAGTTVTGINGNNITISNPATIASGTTIYFTAPISVITLEGALENVKPVLSTATYNPATTPPHTFPNYWQNTGSYFQATVFNGAFDSAKKLQDISYDWNTSQPGFLSGGGNVSFYTQGSKKFIVLSSNTGDAFSLSLDDTGKVELTGTRIIDITENFAVSFTATDAGGSSVTVPVSFTYVEPGVRVSFYRGSPKHTTKSAACNAGTTINIDNVYMSKSDFDNNFMNPAIEANIQLYTDINKTQAYAPAGGTQYLYYEDNTAGAVALEVNASGIIQQESMPGILCSITP